MEYKALELKVGFTVFVGVVVFAVGMMWLEDFKLRGERYEIHAVFPMVGGIDAGDAVNVNGVERGEVAGVVLRERDVIVTMKIDAGTKIPEDSKVVLQTLGIMGERIVTIIVGGSEVILEPGAIINGVYDPGISEALASMGKVMEDLRGLMNDIQAIARALGEGDELRRTIGNLADASEELRALLEETSPQMRAGARSFGNSALRLDSLLARNESGVDTMLAGLASAGERLPALVERIEEVTAALGRISARLESGDNTMGALLSDRELLDRLESAITSLDGLVTDIRENPKKYLKVEIF
ncbi:MAG: MlaD family protein [Candidatus Krumholzibacteria bacterium]|nr:MlaD family protein [Candidatus Krumholzibacteria bacterium]